MNDTLLAHQIGLAAAAVYVIQLLKASPIPWFNQHSDALNRFVSVLIALATAIGLTMNVHGNLSTGGSIMITFPSLPVILDGASHFLAQIGSGESDALRSVLRKLRGRRSG